MISPQLKPAQPLSQASPDHSAGWLWCAVAPVGSLSLTEAYLRLIGTQHSSTLQCPRWHGDAREELGFKDVVIRIVRVSEASTANYERHEILFSQGLIDSSIWYICSRVLCISSIKNTVTTVFMLIKRKLTFA